eukprot:TRINITY_DN3060_c0_g2_i4.p2 TRINITY_DN3060_c0_g2~~TRINITY_DN3060_c0_g2_i4.p2  ORF type:complete len:174 (-),score=20.31 TRINITY_DN3060_c0_g2_i4:104-625(-)
MMTELLYSGLAVWGLILAMEGSLGDLAVEGLFLQPSSPNGFGRNLGGDLGGDVGEEGGGVNARSGEAQGSPSPGTALVITMTSLRVMDELFESWKKLAWTWSTLLGASAFTMCSMMEDPCSRVSTSCNPLISKSTSMSAPGWRAPVSHGHSPPAAPVAPPAQSWSMPVSTGCR